MSVKQQKISISLSWPFSSFVAAGNFICSFTLLFRGRRGQKSVGRATRTGLVWWSRVRAGGMASPVRALVCGCVNPGFSQSPGVICVIITIITLRLQEISTVASEEKPCLLPDVTTGRVEQCTSSLSYLERGTRQLSGRASKFIIQRKQPQKKKKKRGTKTL